MTAIPINTNQTILKIDQMIEDAQDNGFREHLGASIIGDPCSRKLWYSHHWCTKSSFDGRIVRLFETGDVYETRLIDLLKRLGVNIFDRDPNTGDQFKVSAIAGHFGGSLDAVASGFIEGPATWHVCEFKTHADKYFNQLKKDGVAKAFPKHYAQMQIYMGLTDYKRAFYLAVNKNTDELYQERVKFDKKEFDGLMKKAERIIKSDTPLTKLSEKPDWWECKFCQHNEICHYNTIPEMNCRTCIHATCDTENGGWKCEAFSESLSKEYQMHGCNSHLFNPALIPFAQMIDYDKDNAIHEWVKYKFVDSDYEFINRVASISCAPHEDSYTSYQLAGMAKSIMDDRNFKEIKAEFNLCQDEINNITIEVTK